VKDSKSTQSNNCSIHADGGAGFSVPRPLPSRRLDLDISRELIVDLNHEAILQADTKSTGGLLARNRRSEANFPFRIWPPLSERPTMQPVRSLFQLAAMQTPSSLHGCFRELRCKKRVQGFQKLAPG
jgi:hypothetical protein